MSEFVGDEEILEFAIAREVDANRFFLVLARRVKDDGMRRIFEELADEELEHKAKLELEIMKLGRPVSPDAHGLLDVVDNFGDGPDLDVSYRDMLIMGMKKEETSFRLYVDLAAKVTDPSSKETLLALAEEEVRHKIRFQVEYENATKKA